MDTDIEKLKLDQDRRLAVYNTETQLGLSVITLGQNALKSALLINGGAAVALLAFIGNIWDSGIGKEPACLLASALKFYAIGVLVAAVGNGATYCSQHFYQLKKEMAGLIFQYLAIFLVVAAYYFFYSGSMSSYDAIIRKFLMN